MKKLNKKGFTLIEIIVVVVVLAVLMAVAVPSVLKYVNEADNAKFMAQGRSVMNMAQTELVKAYVGDSKVTEAEAKKLQSEAGTLYNEDGMSVTDVVIYVGNTALTVTVNSDGSLTPAGTALPENSDTTNINFKGVSCKINGKQIVAVANDKVYVAK